MELKNFFTQIEPINFKINIGHKDHIVSIGSCFSTEIGNKLDQLGFNILVNPFGTLFNPISTFNLILSSIEDHPISEEHIVYSNGLYYHYYWHSSVYGKSKEELTLNIKNIQNNVREKLKHSNYLILTFGTAIVHQIQSSIVSNCHKQDKRIFSKRFLTIEELRTSFNHFNKVLLAFNPSIKILTTTSPIRHIKEGLVDNNRSKSILNVFNMHLTHLNTHVEYFPSYEIVLDVLRDYRFYKDDLIHPNDKAIDQVWNYFYDHIISPSSYTYITLMKKYIQMQNHKVMFPESELGKSFQLKKDQLYLEIQKLK